MDNRIDITIEEREAVLLPLEGEDDQGNLYQADNISLLKNHKRFIPVMGEFHFSRYEPEAWEEELLKMRAGGVDIVATYVFWIHHEERQGEWNFEGCRNLRGFLEICRRIHMPVCLRIGPWAHGECRNGGFPDWVAAGDFAQRTDDPAYLALVKKFFGKIGEQSEGMMCKDGGPVLAVQIENEYGHCGGPSNLKEGLTHMCTLKRLAIEAGLIVPYYTATGWGGAYVADREMLPVLGGYVDAPWADSVEELPANENFLFAPYHQDENIGSDLKEREILQERITYDQSIAPYLTAELGGGLQVTAHRRTYPWPEDIEAQALCMLGSGANLLGYYMYHGGINPDGKYSTLQESRETGYANDLPVKSYDFQTCIRQSGEVGKSFGRLKKLHLFLHDFGEILAEAMPYFAVKQPDSPEDMQTLRVCARVNPKEGIGFLFVNNHQRKRKMKTHRGASVEIFIDGESLILPKLTVRGGECGILPFLLPGKGEDTGLPARTNLFLLCRVGKRTFYYAGEGISVKNDSEEEYSAKPWFDWRNQEKKPSENVVILTMSEANRALRAGEYLYITEHDDSCIICENEKSYLLTKYPEETLTIYAENGKPYKQLVRADFKEESGEIEKEMRRNPVKTILTKEVKDSDGQIEYREYDIEIPLEEIRNTPHQLYLEPDYFGDRAEIYLNGRLADDWFTTGEPWHISMKRFGFPNRITLRIYSYDKPIPNPYGNQVYYDLPVEKGCVLRGVNMLREYKLPVYL